MELKDFFYRISLKIPQINWRIKLRHFLFILTAFIISWVLIECISFLLLITVLKEKVTIDYNNSDKLIKLFPAQFRMTADDIRGIFPSSMPLERIGNYLSFPFDPVMGFRRDDAVRWYGGTPENLKSKFLIVTLGGSTTVMDSWPKYLKKYAQIENVKQDIVVCNAGHWGYMTFNEKIYFTSWILPMLEKLGVKPDLVLSLDGVNDIWYRILGYIENKRQKSPLWYSQYHAYHQQLDTDMRHMGELGKSVAQFLSSLGRQLYAGSIKHLSPYFPYTLKVLLEISRRSIQKPPSKAEMVKSTAQNIYPIDENTQNAIIKAFQDSLLDFLGCAEIRGIRFIGYLQPVLLKKYYSYSTQKLNYPDFNYFATRFNKENNYFSRLGGNFIVDADNLYNKAEKMYLDLNLKYPNHFKNLAYIFKEVPQTEQIYNKDAIHYEERGKEIIAYTIIRDLIAKGILKK